MAQDDAVSKALGSAKAEMKKANKLSSEADPQGMFKPKDKPASAPPPAAKAPMSPSMHSGSVQDLNHQTAAAEGAKVGMTVPIMHKGGVMKQDGLALLKKGETVRTPEQEKSMADGKAEEKPKKEKKSSAESLMTSEDKAPKKEAKSEGKSDKKDGKKGEEYHQTVIDHYTGGGKMTHHTHHKHKSNNPDKDVHYASQDLEGVKAGLDQHIGGGAGQVMEAPEPAPQMAAEPAAPPAGAMPAQQV